MKALSLNQPWASAVAVGAKSVETRSRRTHYRGLLAIHASAGRGTGQLGKQPFASIFTQYLSTCRTSHRLFSAANLLSFDELPFGAVIATCTLVDCVPTEDIRHRLNVSERGWGDYSDGRFAWILRDVKPIEKPISAKGALGLWEWTP